MSGATLADPLEAWLDRFPRIAPYKGLVAICIVVAAVTYLSPIIGGLVPTQIALKDLERIALRVAGLLTLSRDSSGRPDGCSTVLQRHRSA